MRWIALLTILMFNQLTYSRTLNIALTAFTAPFVMTINANHQYSGFSVDIMQSICQRINATCNYQTMNFYKIFDAIVNDEYDLAIGDIMITAERKKIVLFSLPFLNSTLQFIARADSNIDTIEGFKGKKVGALIGGLSTTLLIEQFGDDVKYVAYDNDSSMVLDLYNHKIDAAVTDSAIVQLWQANDSSLLKLVGEPIPMGQGYGIMTAKFNTELMAEINEALLSMERDGTYLKIYRTYFGD